VLEGKEMYCETKYSPAGILHIGNDVIYFRLKLLLEFRSNKIYFSKIVNFQTGLRLKCFNTRLLFRKNKNYHEKSFNHWYVVTALLLKSLK